MKKEKIFRCEKDLENRELQKLDQETAEELKGNEGTPNKWDPGEPKIAKRLMRDLFMGPNSPFGHPYHAKVAMERYIETADGYPFWIGEGEVRGHKKLDVERATLVIRWIAENFRLKSDTDAHARLAHAVEGEGNADPSPNSSFFELTLPDPVKFVIEPKGGDKYETSDRKRSGDRTRR